MSGPILPDDVDGDSRPAGSPPEIEVTDSHVAQVGGMTVRRALPRRDRRTVGAWCFADHMGPHSVDEEHPIEIGPHPHIGLQTVTWLTSGALLHRDSLGSEQPIRPGQLNLMTAGHGVSHSEESAGRFHGELQGIQLWVAQPEATRHGPPAFEHHDEVPRVDLDGATASVLVGSLGGVTSPARRDTDLLGAELNVRSRTSTALDPAYEHAVVVIEGAVTLRCADESTRDVGPGHLMHLPPGHDELVLDPVGPTRLMLLGGVPFESKILMWWNFVARSHDEVDAATAEWNGGSDRFGDPGSPLGRMRAPDTPW